MKSSRIKSFNTAISLLILIVLIIMPLIMLLLRMFIVDDNINLVAPLNVFKSSALLKIFFNTLYLGLLVVLVSTIMATPLSFLMAKTSMGRHKWLDVVFLVPFMTPPYIASMGWILFMQQRGFMDQLLPFLSFTRERFFSLSGIVFIMSLNLFPFIYLILKNSLLDINSSLEKAGYIHGGSFFYNLRKIIFPLVLSAYSMGALLIFVKTISEFGTPATLGRRIQFYVLTTEIHKFTSNWPIDFGKAAAISSVLLFVSMLTWYLQKTVENKYNYSIVGGKSHGRIIYQLGKFEIIAWVYVGFLILLSIVIPYFSIISTSIMRLRGFGLAMDNFTINNYIDTFSSNSQGKYALFNSLKLAFISATLCLILGTFFAIVVTKSKGIFSKLIDMFSLLSNTVPSIVIVVGLIMFWNAPWMVSGVYNTTAMLVIAYTALFIPFSFQYVKASLQQINKSLYSAAKICGAGRFYLIKRIVLPLIKSGMLSGWIMVFIISSRELVASLMVRPSGYETSGTFIYGQFEQGNVSQGMAMAVCVVTITIVILLILQRTNKKVGRR